MRRMPPRLLPAPLGLGLRVPNKLSAGRIDPGQAEQVLLNLVVNAGAAMPEGGSVVIELADAPQGGAGLVSPCVCLSVADAGVGMDESTRAAIFEPYFTTKPDGTGLGLSIVHDVVARSGGAVSVESEPSRGSRFRVYWPPCDEKPSGGRSRHRPARGQKAARRASRHRVDGPDAGPRLGRPTRQPASHR